MAKKKTLASFMALYKQKQPKMVMPKMPKHRFEMSKTFKSVMSTMRVMGHKGKG